MCAGGRAASHAGMAKRIIAFDLDGTLVDTAPDLIGVLNAVLGERGIPPIDYGEARAMIGGGVKPLLERALAAQGVAFTPEDLGRLFAVYLDRYAAEIADRSRPFPGLEQALDGLAAQGFGFAVCTNKLEWLAVKLLDALGLAGRFGAICGQDTFGVPKPDPEMFRKTIRRAGGDPAEALMVGDSGTDVDTARAAGVPVIAVDFGYTETPVALLAPDRVISHFDQLSGAIDELLEPGAPRAARVQRGVP